MLLRIIFHNLFILLNVKFGALCSLVLQDSAVAEAETSEISYKMEVK